MARYLDTLSQAAGKNGESLPGATLGFFEAGTTTPLDTFQDEDLTILNTNPVVADGEARFPDIFLKPQKYFIEFKDSDGVLKDSQDDVTGAVIGSNSLENIAAMTALVKSTLLDGDSFPVDGYFTRGDEGGGRFFFDASSTEIENLGTIFETDEGGTGRWIRIIDDLITVKMFGAVGDGTTDDTAAIQAAYDAEDSIYIPEGNYKIVGTLNVDRPFTKICGAGLDVTTLQHRPATAITCVNVELPTGNARNIILEDFSIEGALVSNTSVGDIGLRANFFSFLHMRLNLLRYNGVGHIGMQLLGGDIGSAEFSNEWSFWGKIDSCTNGIQVGSLVSTFDGPVNHGAAYTVRIANSGGDIGVQFLRGFANTLYSPNIEGYTTAINFDAFGNGYVGGDFEGNTVAFTYGPNLLQAGERLPEVDAVSGSNSDLATIDPEFPINIDTFNGRLASRSINASPRNCVLNGDFFEGISGRGDWSTNIVHDTSNSLWSHGWVHEINAIIDPGGPFKFVPGTFKAATWYTLAVWAKADSTITSGNAFRCRVGVGDTGYQSGKSDIDGEALYLVGNQRRSISLNPSNAMDKDDKYRLYVLPFFTDTNTDFPSALEIINTAAPTGGSVWIGSVGVFEGTGVFEFNLSELDFLNRRLTEPVQTSSTLSTITVAQTLPFHGGHAYGDTSGGSFVLSLPSAAAAGRGTRWTVTKIETSAPRLNVAPQSGEEVNGATGIWNTPFFDSAYSSATFESNGIDGWTVVGTFK